MKQKPYFPFYTQDFLGSLDVQLMNPADIGCYCLLLFNMYNNGGFLPNNADALRTLCRGIAPTEKVLKKFYADGEFLRNKRIDEELKKQSKFSKAMKDAADKRWHKANKKSMPTHSQGNAKAMGRKCSSYSSSYSSSEEEKIDKKENPTPGEIMRNFVLSVKNKDSNCQELIQKINLKTKIDVNIISAELDKFVSYWTEKTKSGKQQKWETEKTWEVPRRLDKWFQNFLNPPWKKGKDNIKKPIRNASE